MMVGWVLIWVRQNAGLCLCGGWVMMKAIAWWKGMEVSVWFGGRQGHSQK